RDRRELVENAVDYARNRPAFALVLLRRLREAVGNDAAGYPHRAQQRHRDPDDGRDDRNPVDLAQPLLERGVRPLDPLGGIPRRFHGDKMVTLTSAAALNGSRRCRWSVLYYGVS